MIDLPQPPNTFTTLQIQCVACHEVYTIAEAYRTPANRWRLPPDHHPTVKMRYEGDHSRQPGFSARADPLIDPLSFQGRYQDTYINCPRCGADNRNWLQIKGPLPIPSGCLLKFLVPRSFFSWQQRFHGAFLSIFIAIFLAPLTFLMAIAVQDSLVWATILAVAVVFAAAFTAIDLTSDWISLRLDRYIRPVVPGKRPSLEAKLWQRGVVIIVLLGFLMPIVFFQGAPRALGIIAAILRDTPQTAVEQGQQRLTQIDKTYSVATIAAIEQAVEEIENIENNRELGSIEAETRITAVLDRLQADLERQNLALTDLAQKDVAEQRQSLAAFVAESERLIQERRLEADANALQGITADFQLIGLWWLMVGLSTFIAVFMSMRSLKDYVAAVDSVLPRPIFSSIADMTRVTIWEAKRSLQIDGDMSHIQWIEAQRNNTGGIDLIGLCRTDGEVDEQGNPVSQLVRAQRYIIQTDMWGRILRTVVRDVRVPPAQTSRPPGSGEAEREMSWLQKPPSSDGGRAKRPTPPRRPSPTAPQTSGDNLAQKFFSESGFHTQVMATETAVATATHTINQTAISPIRANPVSRHLDAVERQEQLCQEFVRVLGEIVLQDEEAGKEELGKLFRALDLDCERLPGTLKEKCEDLVKFYKRRQRLAELVDICVCRHRDILWGDIFDLIED